MTLMTGPWRRWVRSAYRRIRPAPTPVSDMVIEEIREGTGPMPLPGQIVVTHYTGWLADGTPFDSSKPKGKPFEFTLGQNEVIRGWEIAVETMRVGGCRRVVLPPQLAYGKAGTPGGPIPPNATLTFEIELLDVRSPE